MWFPVSRSTLEIILVRNQFLLGRRHALPSGTKEGLREQRCKRPSRQVFRLAIDAKMQPHRQAAALDMM